MSVLPMPFASPLSAMVLSVMLGAVPAAALAAPAQEQNQSASESDSPYFKLRKAISEAAKAERWDEAIAQARALYEMTLPGQNPYEQMDVSDLLYALLYQQRQYAQALVLTDQVLAQTARYESGPIPGQMQALVQRGVMAAVMAGDKPGQERYLQVLKKEAQIYAPQWQWDEGQGRVIDGAAQLNMPLLEGRWILSQLKPAKDRKESSSYEYIYLLPNGKRFLTRVQLSYDERQQSMGADALQKVLQDERGVYVADAQQQPDLKLAPLPFTASAQIQYATREKREGRPDMLNLYWGALRGNWHLTIHAQLLDSERDAALQQIPQLWAAMQWPSAPELPAQLPQQEQKVTSAWQRQSDWSQAGELARSALPQAIYPGEVARLSTVAGISAFKVGQHAEAKKYLDRALQAWPYASLFRLEAELQENAQQYAAALAAMQGRDAEAALLMRQYLRNAGGLQNIWALADDPQLAQLKNRRTGLVLPMRAAGFHLQEPLDNQRMMYRDLVTEQQVGLTMGLKIPESDAQQEKLLRNVLDKQFRQKAGRLQVQPFQPQTGPGRPAAQGWQWVFQLEEEPQSSRVLDVSMGAQRPAAKQMVFWIVDQGGVRSIARASVTFARDQTRAKQLIEALRW